MARFRPELSRFFFFFSFLIWMMGNGWMYLITKSGWIKPSWLQRFRFKSRSSRNTLLDMRCESNQRTGGGVVGVGFVFWPSNNLCPPFLELDQRSGAEEGKRTDRKCPDGFTPPLTDAYCSTIRQRPSFNPMCVICLCVEIHRTTFLLLLVARLWPESDTPFFC